MKNLIVVLMGGLSGERKISFLTGKACSKALKKKGYKVKELDAKGHNKTRRLNTSVGQWAVQWGPGVKVRRTLA